jgi:hypothetical protein
MTSPPSDAKRLDSFLGTRVSDEGRPDIYRLHRRPEPHKRACSTPRRSRSISRTCLLEIAVTGRPRNRRCFARVAAIDCKWYRSKPLQLRRGSHKVADETCYRCRVLEVTDVPVAHFAETVVPYGPLLRKIAINLVRRHQTSACKSRMQPMSAAGSLRQ